jgi:hypothetical protein
MELEKFGPEHKKNVQVRVTGCYFYSSERIGAGELSRLTAASGSARLNKVGHMNKVTFPNACQLMRWHFHPIGFEASMDAPSSMVARLFDRASGETVIAIAAIPCATVMNAADVERIIEAIEYELETFVPSLTLKVS